MTLPRDISRCFGSKEHESLCDKCSRYVKNNKDSDGERVVYAEFFPVSVQNFYPTSVKKLSGIAQYCTGFVMDAKR